MSSNGNYLGKFGEAIFPDVQIKIFKKTETFEEYVARKGKVTKLPTVPSIFTQSIRSTATKPGSLDPRLTNFESELI